MLGTYIVRQVALARSKIRETELRPTPTLRAIARTDRFATKCNSKIRFTFLIGTRLVGMIPRNLG